MPFAVSAPESGAREHNPPRLTALLVNNAWHNDLLIHFKGQMICRYKLSHVNQAHDSTMLLCHSVHCQHHVQGRSRRQRCNIMHVTMLVSWAKWVETAVCYCTPLSVPIEPAQHVL